MHIQELEYKGINLMDVVGTVEIAIDSDLNTIHVYDTDQIVEPEYNFKTKNYVLSEGFYKMAKVLKEKQFFLKNNENNLNNWIESHCWIFYSSKNSIKEYMDGEMGLLQMASFINENDAPEVDSKYYRKYINRLKSE